MAHRPTRRGFLRQLASVATGGLAVTHPWLLGCDRPSHHPEPTSEASSSLDGKKRYVIVIGATGGASIIDSFLAIRHSEAGANYETLNCFPDADVVGVSGTPFRAVSTTLSSLGPIPLFGQLAVEQQSFVAKHHQDMMVATVTGSSVNHAVAQHRAVSGGGVWAGRTLQELVATTYGADQPLANVNLTSGNSFGVRGADETLPEHAYPVAVADPVMWSMGLHGSRGLGSLATGDPLPDASLIALARQARDEGLEGPSGFAYTFAESPALQRWLSQRKIAADLENRDLITKLSLLPEDAGYPLSSYGLSESPDVAKVAAAFPNYQLDPVEAQAALAFLLLKNDVTSAVTLAPSFELALGVDVDLSEGLAEGVADFFYNLPLAFDFSHTGHRSSQQFMWMRTLALVDRLIDLLKNEPAPEGDGDSLWDRTLIYVATDFGRDKGRPGLVGEWSTGHELNNGVLVLSPMVNGNTLLGGVDPATGYTFGFDPQTGAPDPNREMNEQEIFAGLLQALGIDTSEAGLGDVPAMRKA